MHDPEQVSICGWKGKERERGREGGRVEESRGKKAKKMGYIMRLACQAKRISVVKKKDKENADNQHSFLFLCVYVRGYVCHVFIAG